MRPSLAQSSWVASGLSDAHAKRLGFKQVNARTLDAKFHDVQALHIPYFDLQGKKTKFYRVRYLEQLPGVAGVVAKPQRYDQLAVMQEAYFPPLLKASWLKISQDSDISICFTEGEKKAACACANGIPMIALGGVYSFMSSKNGVDLLPLLKQFKWKERKIYIAYDNDITQKPEVMEAQRRLSQALLALGAKISYVAIPPGPEKGVDDFIVKFGAKAFGELIEKAEPFLEGDALWKLNEEVVFIKNDGVPIVVERASSMTMNVEVFQRAVYANRHYMQQLQKGSGKTAHVILEKTQLAPRWIQWEHRAELGKLVYEPGHQKVYQGKHFKGWNTWDGWGLAPKKGNVQPWHELLDFLFQGDVKTRKWFEQWCAYPIQNPGAKLYTACLLWSRVKRLGKSMIGISLAYIYGQNAIIVDSKQLKGSFNSWAKDRQFIVGEEITAGEARVDADWLKGTITNPFFTINSKFKAEYTIRNCMNFLFFSNHPDALFLEDGDKRYMIHEIVQNSPMVRGFYERLNSWLHKDGDAAKGAGVGPPALMDYFLHLDLKGFNPREHAPETRGRSEMIRASKTDAGLWVAQLQEDAPTALKSMGQEISVGCDIFTPSQLYRCYDPEERGRGRTSVNALGKLLAAAGYRSLNGGLPVVTQSGVHRLYAVRNQMRWEQSSRREIQEHYNQFFGTARAGEVK